ncbi:MAG TPA: response regulator [Candidatus Paceibacterota bacterium]
MARILLAEDDTFLASIVSRELRSEYDVIAVRDGVQLFQQIERGRPDVILLDLIMPDMDGFQVLARLKKDPSLSSIPVLVLTNLGEKADVARALEAGAAEVMVKVDFTPQELHEKINRFLEHMKADHA